MLTIHNKLKRILDLISVNFKLSIASNIHLLLLIKFYISLEVRIPPNYLYMTGFLPFFCMKGTHWQLLGAPKVRRTPDPQADNVQIN